jgi:uncharacterized protein YbjT (DUF2867 family)
MSSHEQRGSTRAAHERVLNMTYAVAGVTGNTGSVVARTLLAAGEKVRVIVRDAQKGESWKREGAEVAVADLADAKALTAALKGVKGAYLLLPPLVLSEEVVAQQARVTESLATAVGEANVPHVVFLSSIAAQLERGTGPIITVAQAEKRFARVTGTVFTFLRPAYFMENFASSLGGVPDGVFNTFLEQGKSFPTIATQDIGHAAAARLRAGARKNEVVQLAGPSDITIEQVAAAFSEVARRPLTVQVAPVDIMVDVLAGFGISRDMGRLYAEMTASMNRGEIRFDPALPLERGTTPLAEVAKKLVG